MRHEPRLTGLRRLFSLPRTSRRLEHDVDQEIGFHVDSRTADLIAQGLSPDAARQRALSEYGDLAASRRELTRVDRGLLRRERWAMTLDAARQDLVYAARSLRKEPSFTAAVVAVLACGIGANATMFGVIDRLLLRPPAGVVQPRRVMTISYLRTSHGEVDDQDYLSYPIYLDARATDAAFADVAAYEPASLAAGVGADAENVRGLKVSANFFRVLGVRAALGRLFVPADDATLPAANVAVLSYGYWRQRYAADPTAVGRTLQLGETKFTIVGVAPEHFTGVTRRAVDLWIPITADVTPAEYAGWTKSRNNYWMLAVGRLRAGVGRELAMSMATARLREGELRDGVSPARIAEVQPRIGLHSVLPREALANNPDSKVAVLLGAVSLLVLLIACANVASLELARGLRRRREIAIRVALGVSQRRLLGQLVMEGVLLALGGGVAALLVARLASEALHRVLFTSLDWSGSFLADPRVLAYTGIASVVVGVATGVLPAVQARALQLTSALKEGVREGRAHRTSARTALLVLQTAICVLLLAGTGLFVVSLRRIRALPIGMEPERVAIGVLRTAGVTLSASEIGAGYGRLLRDAASLPGVEHAALTTSLPFYSSWSERVRVPGRDSLPSVRDGGPYFYGITGGYFDVMGMHLLRGRGITDADVATSPRVVVINQSLARLWWPGEDAIGKCMIIGADTTPCATIVGVVANARRQALIEDMSLQYFLPIEQAPVAPDFRVLVVRPRGPPSAAAEPLRRQLQALEPGLPYLRVLPLEDLVSPETRSWRLGASMFGAFGVLALLLAAVGLYGLLAYLVAQRAHELGVRVALGANVPRMAATVATDGMRPVAAGITFGLVLTLLAGRFVEPLLFRTSPREPMVLGAAVGVLCVVALLAMVVPTWRAVRVDPMVALRSE